MILGTIVFRKLTEMTEERVQRNAGRRLDRYGWFVSEKQVSRIERKHIKSDEKKEAERTKKWLKMLPAWDHLTATKHKRISRRVKKGIPDSIRAKAWQTIIGIHETPPPLSELLALTAHSDAPIIDKDIPRVLPHVGFFSRQEFLDSLRDVLYAYCHVDTELGYTQGMTSIPGILLSYMSQEDAFTCFVNVMKGPLDHRLYFTEGFPKLQVANRVLELLLKKNHKQIWKALTNAGVHMSMFTTRWFLTAFQGYHWHPEFSLRIFDRFLFFGTRALIGFALTILIRHEDVILSGRLEDICLCLQHPDQSEQMESWHEVLQVWDGLWIRKRLFEVLWNQEDTTAGPDGPKT